jgi:hypothetical protein
MVAEHHHGVGRGQLALGQLDQVQPGRDVAGFRVRFDGAHVGNYFGIKCFYGSPGPIANGCHTYATYECEPTCPPTYASFRT